MRLGTTSKEPKRLESYAKRLATMENNQYEIKDDHKTTTREL